MLKKNYGSISQPIRKGDRKEGGSSNGAHVEGGQAVKGGFGEKKKKKKKDTKRGLNLWGGKSSRGKEPGLSNGKPGGTARDRHGDDVVNEKKGKALWDGQSSAGADVKENGYNKLSGESVEGGARKCASATRKGSRARQRKWIPDRKMSEVKDANEQSRRGNTVTVITLGKSDLGRIHTGERPALRSGT